MSTVEKPLSVIVSILALLLFVVSTGVAQKIDNQFFNQVDALLKDHVSDGLVDYRSLKTDKRLPALIKQISVADISTADANTKQAFYINAYNLNVINNALKNYPSNSVLDKAGFFDSKKITVANERLTLNGLEKNRLLNVYHDARYHFVLVCGALGCPPITNFAYTPELLESQLEKQAKLALNDNDFIKVTDGRVELSEIFDWYAKDFGKSNEQVIRYINNYRDQPISTSAKVKYYNYDWSLNDTARGIGSIESRSKASNESRYIVSSTIPKGSLELKIFNNLYSQQTGRDGNLTDRSSFFTTSLSAFYGLSNRVNVGLATRYRKVRNNPLPSSPFSVFGSGGVGSSRSGLTAIGPQIRYAPVPKWENFSIQSSFVLPIGSDLAGGENLPFIDWTGATWNTQFFNDFSIGNKFSLFTEVDVLIEDIGSGDAGHINRFSTPVTAIFSYIPTNKLTIYTLGGYSPYWQSDFDYFAQFGVGTKFQFTPKLELELLYTDFTNQFLSNTGGQAETINLGFRINL